MENRENGSSAPLRDLRVGDRVNRALLLVDKRLLPFKNKPGQYLSLRLRDSTAEMPGKVWQDAEAMDQALCQGNVLVVEGVVKEFQGNLEIHVDAAGHPADAEDISAYVPWAPDYQGIKREFSALLQQARGQVAPEMGNLLDEIFSGDFWNRFARAPAAKFYHHYYAGGLMEHTVQVVRNARALAGNYPQADLTLVLGGAFLHDVGKVQEMTMQHGGVQYSVDGELFGHVVLGTFLVQRTIRQLREDRGQDFSAEMERLVLHIMASHHGEREWGALQKPRLLEALLVHFADQVDGEAFKYLDVEGVPGDLADAQRLKRNIYIPQKDWAEPGGLAE